MPVPEMQIAASLQFLHDELLLEGLGERAQNVVRSLLAISAALLSWASGLRWTRSGVRGPATRLQTALPSAVCRIIGDRCCDRALGFNYSSGKTEFVPEHMGARATQSRAAVA